MERLAYSVEWIERLVYSIYSYSKEKGNHKLEQESISYYVKKLVMYNM